MKYLSDYQNDKQTKAFNKFGAFFAFSQKQLNEQKKDGFKYVSLGSGMIVPPYNVDNLMQSLNLIHKQAIQQDIADNGIKAIIHRELGNHECQITMSINNALDALDGYGITRQQVQAEWSEYFQKCIDNNWF